jgi:predicted RNA-binding protein with PUA domain
MKSAPGQEKWYTVVCIHPIAGHNFFNTQKIKWIDTWEQKKFYIMKTEIHTAGLHMIEEWMSEMHHAYQNLFL